MQTRAYCLNIGSGLSRGKGWMHIDGSPTMILVRIPILGARLIRRAGFPARPEDTRYGNILSPRLVPENSCDLVFLSRVLEHLTHRDALHAVRNCHRFLRPGGIARIIVPNLESIARDYLRGLDKGDAETSGKCILELGMAPPEASTSLESRMRCIFGHSRHQWMHDRHSLLSLLRQMGFSENRVAGFGDWSDERFSEVE